MITCGKAKFWCPYMDNDFNICFKYNNFNFKPNKVRADINNRLIIVEVGKENVYGRLKNEDVFKIQEFKNKILVDLKQSYKRLKSDNKVIVVDYGSMYMIFTRTILNRGYLSIKYYNGLVYYFQNEKQVNVSNYEELCRKISKVLTKEYINKKSKKHIKDMGYMMDVDDLTVLLK